MRNQMAETVAEANAQTLTLPAELDSWRTFASLLDGYAIAQELGFDLKHWAPLREGRFAQTGKWNLNALELRLMLFYEFRADYMSGYTYHERDETVDSLLRALSQLTGLPYPSK